MTFYNHLKGYQLIFSKDAQHTLKKLEKTIALKIQKKLICLVNGEQNLDIKKLQASAEPTYRLRVGDMRVIYMVQHQQVIVYIITIGHRKEIYE